MKKETKGITLIALVITIIVLLILAGITIATLTGENGILTKANESKTRTEKAGAYEQVQVQVLGSIGEDGQVNIDKLNENLRKNIPGLTYNGKPITEKGENENKIKELPTTVTVEEYSFIIDEDGNVTEISEIAKDIIENPKKYYGKEVTNYTAGGKTWRIFYVDATGYFGDPCTIYLKADWESNDTPCQIDYNSETTLVKKMNPLWAAQRGGKEEEWRDNEKATAWLCDPSKWTKYCDEEKANYAIGGPSVEMYVKSYNQTHEKGEGQGNNELGYDYSETDSPGYIYIVNGEKQNNDGYYTNNNILDYENYNSMYCGKNGTKTGYWWLASPSARRSDYMCGEDGILTSLRVNTYKYYDGVDPLVSLKSSFIPEIGD